MSRTMKDILTKIAAAASAVLLILAVGRPVLRSAGRAHVAALPQGEVSAGVAPAICIGAEQTGETWGVQTQCPKGYAFFGVDDPAGKKGPAEHIYVFSHCCPLPAADILTEDHLYAPSACPADRAATGSRTTGVHPSTTTEIRCTKINTARYQLGPPTEAIYWGRETYGYAGWQGSKWIDWKEIPAGIRFAQGRVAVDRWDIDGCVGYPWGSLLTGKEHKYCSGFKFRQLQFTGAAGDPPAGTAVLMFPDCAEIENPDDAQTARCVPTRG